MKKLTENNELIEPINTLSLQGYENLFKYFVKMHENNSLPNTILLSGQKGLGKSVFVYHFINYLLSKNEQFKYCLETFSINADNKSYNLLCAKSHPNFFLLDTSISDDVIKIEQVRLLLNFLSKSTYSDNLKIIMINNVEFMNKNSSNALLKVLEEPNKNTFFFILSNNSVKILNTIKSRSIEFKFYLSFDEKKMIFRSLLEQNKLSNYFETFSKLLYFETPGNLFKLVLFLSKSGLSSYEDKYSIIFYLLDQMLLSKNNELIHFISLYVELYYNELTFKNVNNVNIYNYSKTKILNQINNYKMYNLDKKNLHTSISNIINNG